ncbi:MAG TPA: DUF2950 domain-containing protein [Dongiaceae bacterium]|nr:DUF2950 domain-containing protein [Dongiaceae bacterium]
MSRATFAILLSLSIGGATASAQTTAPAPKPAPPSTPAAKPAAPPAPPAQAFPTPEAAAEALIAAAAAFDVPALTKILGADGIGLVVTKDKVQDENQAKAFAAEAQLKHSIVRDPKTPKVAMLVIGDDDWPSPTPIIQTSDGRWRFDPRTGRIEVQRRRIGRNELDAIEVCRGFVEAQQEYALTKHDGATVNQYAQRIISTPGRQDGLTWKNPAGQWEGPVAESIARVIAEGYSSRYEPYHGYYFKVLKGQGPHAHLGTMNFVVKGAMIGGFALAAVPSDYGATGVKSFIVSHEGVVYEKDLGPDSITLFKSMQRFDPDPSWSPVEDD